MTWGLLKEILHNIPNNAKLMSDSGWECDPTEMDGVWYDEENNEVVFTQGERWESIYTGHNRFHPRKYVALYNKGAETYEVKDGVRIKI